MKFRILSLLLAAVLAAAGATQAKDTIEVPNFRLLDQHGRSHELYRQSDADQLALVWIDAPDPTALTALRDFTEAQPENTRVFALYPHAVPDRKAFSAVLAEQQITFPVLLDESGAVTRTLGASADGEIWLIDPATWTRTQTLTTSQESAGQPLQLAAWPESISYSKDVAPIIKEKCVTCHVQGGVAPFAFSSHQRTAAWGPMMREVILTGRMPPWHADPHIGSFHNDRSLTTVEKQSLLAWLDAGAPQGGEGDPLAALEPDPAIWQNGEPDKVLRMPEPFNVPAEGVLDYQLFELPAGFEEDVWVRGVEVRPGNAKVVHHALIFINYPEHLKYMEPDADGGVEGYFAGFVPGGDADFFPPGTGKYVPAGATFTFQIHYVTVGKEESDQTELGLYLCDSPPDREMVTRAAFDVNFEIPPNSHSKTITAGHRVWPGEVILHGMAPHMHYRGSQFAYMATYPSGETEVLLTVPNYNFDWQTMYWLEVPKVLPPGTTLFCAGTFDNTAANPWNPDPSDTVRFGDQTYEEMFIGYLNYTVPRGAIQEAEEQRLRRMERRREQIKAELEEAAKEPPLTAETLENTKWTGGQFKLHFQADNVLLVNDTIKGVFKIENGKVIIDVVGNHFEMDIIGSKLYAYGTYEMERLE